MVWSKKNRSMPSTEGVLTKLFNIQLTKIKNRFSNYCVFFIRWSFFVEEMGGGPSITMCKWSNHVLPWYWALKPLWRWLLSVTKCSRSQFLLLIMGAGIFIPVSLSVKCHKWKKNTCQSLQNGNSTTSASRSTELLREGGWRNKEWWKLEKELIKEV